MNWLNIATLNPSAPYVIANSQKWMFSSNGWRAPTQHYVPGASALFGVSEKWFISDDYWTFAPRFLLSNWYLTAVNAATQQEAANGNSINIEGVSVQIGLTGSPVQLTVNGSTSVYTLADDSEIWTDAPSSLIAIPPRTRCCVRVAWAVPNSASNLSSPYPGIRQMFGDKAEISTGSLASKVMAGGIATTVPTGNNVYMYTPIAMVAQGWDGRPVVLGFGTSIEQGVGQSRLHCDATGAIGPIERGLWSTAGGAPRLPGVIWAVSGGFAGSIQGIGNNQGLTRRMRAIAALPNVPMTALYDGGGTNDQTATLATWQSALTTAVGALKAAWPSCRLVKSTLCNRTQSTDAFTTVVNQSAQNSNWTFPTGSAWGLYSWMLGNPWTGVVDGIMDVVDAIDNFSGGGTRGTWRVDLTSKGFATTLSNSPSGGATSFTLAAMPRAGALLSILDGTNEAIIASSISGTAAPFTANSFTALGGAHTSGASVVEKAPTIEGTHPGDVMAQWLGDKVFAAHKLAGTFG
jgi:hypothetical protein